MRIISLFPIVVLITIVAYGCQPTVDSPQGFSFPPGDPVIGEQVFMKYECLSCHTLDGYESPALEEGLSKPIALGGQTHRVITYAELVTAVINPSHKLSRAYAYKVTSDDGQSKMRNFNEVMTVDELIHLVTFLEQKYELAPYQPTNYMIYSVTGH